jgi:outer membrane lipoprotein carrier protein
MLENYITITAIYSASVRHPEKIMKKGSFSAYISTSSLPRPQKGLFWRFLGLLFLSLVSANILPNAASANPLSIDELTAQIQNVYERTRDFQAHFIQEVTIKSMQKTEREEGTVWIKNPKRMFWDYITPKEKKLVINPAKTWLYVAEDRIVYLQNSDDIFRSRLAVKFLSGVGKISDDFAIHFSKEGPLDPEGNYLLRLTAKESEAEVSRMHVTIDKKTFHIIQFSSNDDYGNTTRMRFSQIKTNTGVSDDFFVFRPPSGVEIIHP